MHPAVDQYRAAYTKILRAPGSAPLSLLHSCPGEVRMIPSRGGPAPSIHVFTPRAQLRRSAAHHHRTAHLQLATAPVRSIKAGPGCGARGRRQGLAGHRDDAPNHTSSGRRRCGGRQRDLPQCRCAAGPGRASPSTTSAAGAEGAGGAWPGFETTRRAKLAARTARGRAAAHRHTQRPGPSSQATRRPEHQRRHTQQKPRNLKRSRGPVAEDGGFEPPRACTQHAFQACAIGH